MFNAAHCVYEKTYPLSMFRRFFSHILAESTLRRLSVIVYPLFSGWLVLAIARVFYGTMLEATGGEWSAPLDDVFIHFDFARSTARGYPFQWSEGNGSRAATPV